jgi:peptidoglycan/LPS O-acetylase OafA/YrhL
MSGVGLPERTRQGHPTAQFRPDLEGLRAVAVILVLLYHAKMPGFAGGYVGVDVFFVLSGFLITGLIYRELRGTGEFSFSEFYARRARRLLPAAGVVLLVTLIAAVVLTPSFRLPPIAADIASAGLYVSNMRFGIEANNYFQATSAPSPVLHFWSLSVEEQFYIFWPALLVCFHGWLPGVYSRRNRVAVGVVLLGVASLGLGIWLTGVNQPWAFFLLPTRAWELAIGGLIAVRARDLVALPRWLASIATVIGVVCVIASDVLFTDSTPFPGVAAILPVAGASLVIFGGLRSLTSLPARVLSIPPLRFMGRISYSIYLWHWPILVFGTLILGASMALPLALATIPVAAASQRWIEEPFRRGKFIGDLPRRNLFQAGAAAMVVVMACLAASPSLVGTAVAALGVGNSPPPVPTSVTVLPSPSESASSGPEGSPSVSGQPEDSAPPSPAETSATPVPSPDPVPCTDCAIGDLTPQLADVAGGAIPTCESVSLLQDPFECVYGVPSSGVVVAVFGDSHAQSWLPPLVDIANRQGWRLVALTAGGCPSASVSVWSHTLNRVNTECDEWRDRAFDRLTAERPQLVVVANASHYDLVDAAGALTAQVDAAAPIPEWATLWESGVSGTLDRLISMGSLFTLIGDVPTPTLGGLDPSECIAANPTTFQICTTTPDLSVPVGVHALEASVAEAEGGTFVDPTPWLCTHDLCPAVIGRFVVYRDDSGHMTPPFAASLADSLAAAIDFPR